MVDSFWASSLEVRLTGSQSVRPASLRTKAMLELAFTVLVAIIWLSSLSDPSSPRSPRLLC